MAETSTIFGFMKYVSATDILSDFKKTVDSHFVNSLKDGSTAIFINIQQKQLSRHNNMSSICLLMFYRVHPQLDCSNHMDRY